MDHNLLDFRWWLLSHVVNIAHLQDFYTASVIFFFAAFVFLSLFPLKRFRLSEPAFILSLVLFIAAARWPGFLAPSLNPDESFFISGAMKLLKDPVFWRSVDGTTSGPLNIYPLTIPALFGFRLEYAGARMVGLALVIISVICLYYALRYLYGKSIARPSIIPIATCFALMTYCDYIHYSSEHVSIAISSIALLILCRYYSSGLNNGRGLIFLMGFVVGLIPYAKMQAVPLAFGLSCIFSHILWVRSDKPAHFFRKLRLFLSGLLSFSAFVALALVVFSLVKEFWISYIQANIFYGKSPLGFLYPTSAWPRFLGRMEDTRIFFGLAGIVLVMDLLFLAVKCTKECSGGKNSDTFTFIYYSMVFLAGSVLSVILPARNYTHYMLFLIIPSGFLVGVFLGEINKVPEFQKPAKRILRSSLTTTVITMILAGSCLQLYGNAKNGNQYIDHRKDYMDNYISPFSRSILKYASRGDSMIVWGWAADLYIETGLAPGTRDADSRPPTPSPQQPYFRKRFIKDFLKSNPRLFVDAVAPGFFGLNIKALEGHDAFPEVAAIVQENYRLVEEIQGVRIYVKKRM